MKDTMSQSILNQGFAPEMTLDYLDVDTDPTEKFESGYPYRSLSFERTVGCCFWELSWVATFNIILQLATQLCSTNGWGIHLLSTDGNTNVTLQYLERLVRKTQLCLCKTAHCSMKKFSQDGPGDRHGSSSSSELQRHHQAFCRLWNGPGLAEPISICLSWARTWQAGGGLFRPGKEIKSEGMGKTSRDEPCQPYPVI